MRRLGVAEADARSVRRTHKDQAIAPMVHSEAQRDIGGRRFLRHLGQQTLWAALLVIVSLIVGTAGFHAFAKQEWLDAFLNASMLLGGMGPVGEFSGAPGKLFAALYALYAGLVFLIVAGLLVAPVFHYVLHRFHLEGTKRP